MAGIGYVDLAQRLTPEARTQFVEMTETHLVAARGDRTFLRVETSRGVLLMFRREGDAERTWEKVDGGALDDLVGYGLLHLAFSRQGSHVYRLSGEGVAFYRWLMEYQGGAVAQVEHEVMRVLAADSFGKAHPGTARHLGEAFSLLWQGDLSNQVVSELGDHLRKALMDVRSDVLGPESGGQQEKPVERLRSWLAQSALGRREVDVLGALFDLTRAVLRLDHRLNHVRDEVDKGRVRPRWEEARRAAFPTALTCYELERVGRNS